MFGFLKLQARSPSHTGCANAEPAKSKGSAEKNDERRKSIAGRANTTRARRAPDSAAVARARLTPTGGTDSSTRDTRRGAPWPTPWSWVGLGLRTPRARRSTGPPRASRRKDSRETSQPVRGRARRQWGGALRLRSRLPRCDAPIHSGAALVATELASVGLHAALIQCAVLRRRARALAPFVHADSTFGTMWRAGVATRQAGSRDAGVRTAFARGLARSVEASATNLFFEEQTHPAIGITCRTLAIGVFVTRGVTDGESGTPCAAHPARGTVTALRADLKADTATDKARTAVRVYLAPAGAHASRIPELVLGEARRPELLMLTLDVAVAPAVVGRDALLSAAAFRGDAWALNENAASQTHQEDELGPHHQNSSPNNASVPSPIPTFLAVMFCMVTSVGPNVMLGHTV